MHQLTAIRIFLLAVILIAASCSTAPPVQEYMIINPSTVIFPAPDSIETVSITHSCSCPFSWTSSVSPASPWLIVPSSVSGDHSAIPFQIDRSKLTADTSIAIVRIISNAYGEDSILVKAYK